VQSFPNGGNKYKVTTRGGNNSQWSPDGHQLYLDLVTIEPVSYVADVISTAPFRLGPIRLAMRAPDKTFDAELARDGRLLVLLPAQAESPLSITVVQNWPALLVHK